MSFSSNTSQFASRGRHFANAFMAAIPLYAGIQIATPIEPQVVERLASALETRIVRADLSAVDRLDGIIVLGGSPTRVYAAVDVAGRFPGTPIVLSGPGEREVMIAQKLAKGHTSLIVDRRATTTYENALLSKDLIRQSRDQRWLVVTSAVHMPRAIGAFNAVDFPVLPWPVDDTPTSLEALSDSVWHEVGGLLAYWALGRSSELYPRQPVPELVQERRTSP